MDAQRPGGHVIVCGLGHVGFRVVDVLLRLRERVVVIAESARSEWADSVRERGGEIRIGDARDTRQLLDAGLSTARALVAVTNHDVTNVEIALDAKAERPDLTVVARLFDVALARELLTTLDLSAALSMSGIAAPAFAAAALGESVLASFLHGGEPWVVGRVPSETVTGNADAARPGLWVLDEPGSPAGSDSVVAMPRRDWVRLTTRPAPAASGAIAQRPPWPRHVGRWLRAIWVGAPAPLRLLAITLAALLGLSLLVFYFALGLSFVDALYFLTATVTTTGYGDINLRDAPAALKLYGCLVMLLGGASIATLYSMVTDFIVTSRFREVLGRPRVPEEGHVVVVGLGSLGTRVVEELVRIGVPVVGVDRDPDGLFVATVKGHAPVVVGDARFAGTLEKAAAPRASAVIATTGDDAVNLGVGLGVRRLGPSVRTVVRLFDADFARKVRSGLKVGAALSASRIAAPVFAAAALHPGVCAAFEMGKRFAVLLEREAGAEWAGKRPGELGGVRILERSGRGDAPLTASERLVALEWRGLE